MSVPATAHRTRLSLLIHPRLIAWQASVMAQRDHYTAAHPEGRYGPCADCQRLERAEDRANQARKARS